MPTWDSETYLRFRAERGRPTLDLLARLDDGRRSILDLGCGPGNSTSALRIKYPHADILGVDADDNMLEKARADHPGMRFEKAFLPDDFSSLGTFDLIFSNACIQWIPDQRRLLSEAFAHLEPGGVLAVQVPAASKSPFHAVYLESVLALEKWAPLQNMAIFHELEIHDYYDELARHSSNITIWRTDYHHTVDGPAGMVEWYSGSGLRPFFDRLDALGAGARKEELKADLLETIAREERTLADGSMFLIMPRIFFVAEKPRA